MKPLFSLIILLFLHAGCADNCDLAKTNVFQSVDNSEIENLELINKLILKNVDTLLKANKNNENDSAKNRKDKFHSLTSGLIEKLLPKEDSAEFYRLLLPFNDTKNKFYFHEVTYRPSDSTFDYLLRLDICDNSKKAIDIFHHLLYKINFKNYNDHKNEDFVKEMKINKYWTYYIENKPNDPR